jgi:NADPH:quinone reductase-like Zn-dependent oxidoreductase
LPVPATMSNSTAAQLLSNPLTAVILTGDQLDVRPGEWLLQTAACFIVGQSAPDAACARSPAYVRLAGAPSRRRSTTCCRRQWAMRRSS